MKFNRKYLFIFISVVLLILIYFAAESQNTNSDAQLISFTNETNPITFQELYGNLETPSNYINKQYLDFTFSYSP